MSPSLTESLEVENGTSMDEITTFLDAGLVIWPHFEIYSIDKGFGLKYQVLGNNQNQEWQSSIKVGSIKVDYTSTNENLAAIHHNTTGSEVGISVGYRWAAFGPYVSYVNRNYDLMTSIENKYQKKHGRHQTGALGVEWEFFSKENSLSLSLILETSITYASWPGISTQLAPVHGIQWSLKF
jgi:hypothetical protein